MLTRFWRDDRHFTGDESFMDYEYTGLESAEKGKARWTRYVCEAKGVENKHERTNQEHEQGETEHERHVLKDDKIHSMIPIATKIKARI